MMPGASARPSAFTVSLAAPSLAPTAVILPAVTPRSPRTDAPPVPSKISASLITRSNIAGSPSAPWCGRPRLFSSRDRCKGRSPASRSGEDVLGGRMKGLKRRGFIAAAVGLGAAPGVVRAQDFPNRQVRVVVPYPAGGGTDLVARLVIPRLAERWKQTVIIDNK